MQTWAGARWDSIDIDFECDDCSGNPFDLRLWAEFRRPDGAGTVRLPGFYCGDGLWRLRFMPTVEGRWDSSPRATSAVSTAAQAVSKRARRPRRATAG